MKKIELEQYLKNLFRPELFDDYCPNGLQIEGCEEIKKIVFAVSATRESAEYAASVEAQAFIVHHGLFWKFHGTKPLTGTFYHRVAPLIKKDINLFAYHLPMDGHLEIGNAKSLANLLDLVNEAPFGDYKRITTGIRGELKTPLTGIELKTKLEQILNHRVLYSEPQNESPIRSIGIITGGAKAEWREALSAGLDAYLTGEMSEHDWHESREAQIHMYAGGHSATEEFGIQALMKKIAQDFPSVSVEYFHSKNPA